MEYYFMTNMLSEADDVSVASIMDTEKMPGAPDGFFCLRMQALTFLTEAVRLCDFHLQKATPGFPKDSSSASKSAKKAAFLSHPASFDRLKFALDRFCDSLPPQHRAPWTRWDEGSDTKVPWMGIRKDTAVLSFLIANAYLTMWNVRALSSENSRALLVAKRIVNVLCLFSPMEMLGGYDVFLIVGWNEVAMILLREVKRLQLTGQYDAALPIQADLNIVLTALRAWAGFAVSTDHEGVDVAAVNTKILDRLLAMTPAEWLEAIEESDRRYE